MNKRKQVSTGPIRPIALCRKHRFSASATAPGASLLSGGEADSSCREVGAHGSPCCGCCRSRHRRSSISRCRAGACRSSGWAARRGGRAARGHGARPELHRRRGGRAGRDAAARSVIAPGAGVLVADRRLGGRASGTRLARGSGRARLLQAVAGAGRRSRRARQPRRHRSVQGAGRRWLEDHSRLEEALECHAEETGTRRERSSAGAGRSDVAAVPSGRYPALPAPRGRRSGRFSRLL